MMRPAIRTALAALVLWGPSLAMPNAVAIVEVDTTAEFRSALSGAVPGTTITVAPGLYAGGSYHANVKGTAGAPIVIQGAERTNPPVFRGGYNGIQLSDAEYVTFQDLIFEGASQNGISIDDAESVETPAHHISFIRIRVRNIPDGNKDGIKLSGVTDFVIDDARIERWGGSAVDMVGCHRGLILNSAFTNAPGRGGTGLSMKGGSSEITVANNRFEHGGVRAIQIGGTTSFSFFRPQPPGRAEATAITVERNVILGSETPVTFVGSDGGLFRFNTVYLPTGFLLRILQEHRDPSLVRSQNGVITDNIFYWQGAKSLNIGSNTNPSTFTFARNLWYRRDAPASSQVALPRPETAGVYGVDPQFSSPPGDLRTRGAVPQGAHTDGTPPSALPPPPPPPGTSARTSRWTGDVFTRYSGGLRLRRRLDELDDRHRHSAVATLAAAWQPMRTAQPSRAGGLAAG
jgi:hypothetical protein